MATLYYPEGFFTTTLSADINASTTTIPLTAVPSRVTSGYMVIEPNHATKREVIHFTSVGASTVTAADDTTTASDASGRGCIGSVTVGANTSHSQGVTVIIAATEQYWKRMYDKLTGADSISSPVLTTPQINDTSADHQYVFAVSELSADRTVTLPLLTGADEFVFKDHTQTLTNKTLTTPTIGSFANANHDHTNSAGGGTLTNAALANRTRYVWIPAAMWGVQAGTPVRDVSAAGNYIGWLFDAGGTEVIVSEFISIPSDFAGGDVTIKSFWSMESATSGNVVIDAQYSFIANGENTTGITSIGNDTESVPGSADTLKVTTHSSAISGLTAGDIMKFRFLRVGGDGSDTATGDLRFYGLQIEYTADM